MAAPLTVSLGKDKGRRVDFDDQFDLLIRQKGLRVRWSRAILCPCRLNTKTDQADPSCKGCSGDGWFYILPSNLPTLPEYANVGFVDTANSKATQVIVTGIAKNVEIYENFGEWVFGSIRCTTFSFHDMAYRDRFVFVDGVTDYQQILKVGASRKIPVGREQKINIRYPAKCVLEALEVVPATGAKIDHAARITVEADGSLTFSDPALPALGTLLTVVYQHNPVYVVMQSVLDLRQSPRKFKTDSVLGSVLDFPKLMLAKPDYMPDKDTPT